MRSTIAWTGALLIGLAIFLFPAHGIFAARKGAHQRLKFRPCQIGQCFDVVHGVCSGQACGPGLPQCAAHQMCDRQGRRCSCASAGVDVRTSNPMECNADACSGPCGIPLPCPLAGTCPVILGECAADATGECDCRLVPTPTAGPPTPTPTPQCSGAVCGGPCFIAFFPPFPCPPGEECETRKQPDIPARLGQCVLTAAGDCECMPPPTPTPGPPTPTATPQCSESTCDGPCLVAGVAMPCPPNAPCAELPARMGKCELTANGSCDCVPVVPTPLPTLPPQCSAGACSGSCIVPIPCGSDGPCPEIGTIFGECQLGSAGTCDCVPVNVATPTPEPTISSECNAAACGGLCAIRFCPPGALCPNLLGHCDQNAAGECTCMPGGLPTPIPPPVECASLPCTGRCEILPPCMPGAACPQSVILGTCQVVDDTCTCVPSNGTPPPPPTPGGCGLSCDGRACTGTCPDGTMGEGRCVDLTVDQGCTCAMNCAPPTPMATPCVHCGHT